MAGTKKAVKPKYPEHDEVVHPWIEPDNVVYPKAKTAKDAKKPAAKKPAAKKPKK